MIHEQWYTLAMVEPLRPSLAEFSKAFVEANAFLKKVFEGDALTRRKETLRDMVMADSEIGKSLAKGTSLEEKMRDLLVKMAQEKGVSTDAASIADAIDSGTISLAPKPFKKPE